MAGGEKPKWDNAGCMDRVRGNLDVAAFALQVEGTRIVTLDIRGSFPVANIPRIDRGYHKLSYSG